MSTIDLRKLSKDKPVHFMGIGGAGMAPLADLLRRSGGQVTGCDAKDTAVTRRFSEDGVDFEPQHDPSHIEGCSALVVTAAVPADHPEIAAARSAGIPVLKRAEALGAIVNKGFVVGVAGTHGKTTTTTLTTAVLEAANLNPTGLIGGRVPMWDGNLRLGGDDLYVVEADEFDRSFLCLDPNVAIVTTLEADHLDIYGSFAEVENAFVQYVSRVPRDGLVIGCADDSGVGRLMPRIASPGPTILSYGLSAGSMLSADDVRSDGRNTHFRVRDRGELLGEVTLHAPGLHNVRNSLAAIGAARHLGADWSAIRDGLAQFGGVDRRFQQIGDANGILVIDDYAHHPTEISATLQAAHASYPNRRIVAVFQPHLYSRTRDFADDFGRALAAADLLFVTEIYPAREQPIEGVSGELIVEPARRAGADVRYVADRATVVDQVTAELAPGDVCLTLGAGDLDEAARHLADWVVANG